MKTPLAHAHNENGIVVTIPPILGTSDYAIVLRITPKQQLATRLEGCTQAP